MDVVSRLRGNVSIETIEPVVSACLSDSTPVSAHSLSQLEQITAFLDGTYFVLRLLLMKLKETKRSTNPKPPVYFENVLLVMDSVLRPERRPSNILGQPIKPKSDLARHTQLSYLRHLLTQVWMNFLDNEISDELMLKAMRLLGDGRLNRLSENRLLADYVIPIFDNRPNEKFVSDELRVPPSWSRAVSRTMLGLVHKGGLNYARLYPRLYELLDDSLITCPEVGRFLDDLDLYLSSLHLSTNVVASFLKRLAQLAIISPVRITPSILLLIRNAIRRHLKCAFLVTRKKRPGKGDRLLESPPADSVGDPYSWNPSVLEDSGAMRSSLWEVSSLVHHYSSIISSLANEICHPRIDSSTVESLSPSELIKQQDDELSKTARLVEKALSTLAHSNARLSILPDLEGWAC